MSKLSGSYYERFSHVGNQRNDGAWCCAYLVLVSRDVTYSFAKGVAQYPDTRGLPDTD